MAQKVRIALDAMGGDLGPSVVIPGAAIALERHPDSEFLLFGDERDPPHLADASGAEGGSRIVHTDVAVSMDDKPSQALRRGRWSRRCGWPSKRCKKGEADAAVSAGNTGALMAMSKFCLRTHAGHRPAGDRRVLADAARRDASCSTSAPTSAPTPQQLVDFAVMGSAMARVLFDIERPTVGLLNVGVEEIKGHEEVREAGAVAARGESARSTITASSRATTSARARSTWSSPKASPATSR